MSHLKRLTIPRHWTLAKKGNKWTHAIRPGPHSRDRGVPLALLLRDVLKLCDTNREARRIVSERDVEVDGLVVTDHRRLVGFMDVLRIPKLKRQWRMLIDARGKSRLVAIDEKQAAWKLCRIDSKTTQKGGLTQLNLHDGRNILLTSDKYATGDVLRIRVPEQKVMATYPLEAGNLAYVIGGAHVGQVSAIESVLVKRSSRPNEVRMADEFTTIHDYVFMVGKKKTEIVLPEGHVDE